MQKMLKMFNLRILKFLLLFHLLCLSALPVSVRAQEVLSVLQDTKLVKGRKLSNVTIPENYTLSFIITPFSKPSTDSSIIQFTKDGLTVGASGRRMPGIWFIANTTQLMLKVDTVTVNFVDIRALPQLPLNKATLVKILAVGNTIRVSLNETAYVRDFVLPSARIYGSAQVYLSNPSELAADANVSKVLLVEATPEMMDRSLEKPRDLTNSIFYLGQMNVPYNYSLTFALRPLGKISGQSSILHFTNDNGNCCKPGQRMPALWFIGGTTKLYVRIGTVNDGNWGFDSANELPINETTVVRITTFGRQVMLYLNDSVQQAFAPSDRLSGLAHLWAADPWYERANATISGISMTDADPAEFNMTKLLVESNSNTSSQMGTDIEYGTISSEQSTDTSETFNTTTSVPTQVNLISENTTNPAEETVVSGVPNNLTQVLQPEIPSSAETNTSEGQQVTNNNKTVPETNTLVFNTTNDTLKVVITEQQVVYLNQNQTVTEEVSQKDTDAGKSVIVPANSTESGEPAIPNTTLTNNSDSMVSVNADNTTTTDLQEESIIVNVTESPNTEITEVTSPALDTQRKTKSVDTNFNEEVSTAHFVSSYYNDSTFNETMLTPLNNATDTVSPPSAVGNTETVLDPAYSTANNTAETPDSTTTITEVIDYVEGNPANDNSASEGVNSNTNDQAQVTNTNVNTNNTSSSLPAQTEASVVDSSHSSNTTSNEGSSTESYYTPLQDINETTVGNDPSDISTPTIMIDVNDSNVNESDQTDSITESPVYENPVSTENVPSDSNEDAEEESLITEVYIVETLSPEPSEDFYVPSDFESGGTTESTNKPNAEPLKDEQTSSSQTQSNNSTTIIIASSAAGVGIGAAALVFVLKRRRSRSGAASIDMENSNVFPGENSQNINPIYRSANIFSNPLYEENGTGDLDGVAKND